MAEKELIPKEEGENMKDEEKPKKDDWQETVKKKISSLDIEEKELVSMINRGQQAVSQAQFNLVGVRRARAELKQLLGDDK